MSKVCWYVSAGIDCRPLVFYSRGFKEKHPKLKALTVPTTHVFTCLGGDYLEDKLMRILMSSDKVLFCDEKTRIRISKYEFVKFNLGIQSLHSKRNRCDFERGSRFKNIGADGFYADVLIEDLKNGYTEKTQLLYLLGENISTFDYLVQLGFLNVLHLVATCEGLGFGGCRESIFEHLFTKEAYLTLRKKGFLPESMVVPPTGQAKTHHQYGIDKGMIAAERIGGYLDGHSTVYRIK